MRGSSVGEDCGMIYDAIVVGLGAMGSASVAHAARRGMRVLGIEQFAEGHANGASAGKSRLIRRAYFEDPAYVPLVERAYALWDELERATGANIFRKTGVLLVGPPDSSVLAGSLRSAREHAIAVEELDADALRRRFPVFAVRDGEAGVYEPGAGVLFPEIANAAHLREARAHGAELRFGAAVERWQTGDHDVEVVLSGGERLAARRLALTVGPWLPAFAPELAPPIRVQRNVQLWFAPAGNAANVAPARCPGWLVERADYPERLYGFPDFGDGLKAAFHAWGATTTARELDRAISEADVEPVRAALETWMPGAAGALREGKVCMYALTPDEHFAVGRVNDEPPVVVAGGFSGHGFKFSSAIGEVVTDLLETGASRHDVAFLAPQRFAKSG